MRIAIAAGCLAGFVVVVTLLAGDIRRPAPTWTHNAVDAGHVLTADAGVLSLPVNVAPDGGYASYTLITAAAPIRPPNPVTPWTGSRRDVMRLIHRAISDGQRWVDAGSPITFSDGSHTVELREDGTYIVRAGGFW